MERRVGSRWLVAICWSLLLVGALAALPAAGADVGAAAQEPTVDGPDSGVLSGPPSPPGAHCGPADSIVSIAASPATSHDDGGASTATAAGSSATASASSASVASASQASESIVERVEYHRLPDEPDSVQARISYEIPENVDSLRFGIVHGDYEVVETEGFTREDGEFVWDGSSDGGAVTIRHDPAESFREEPPDDRYVGGTEDWAIVTRPQTGTEWNYTWDNPGLEYELETTTEGYAGTRFAFLGAHETYEETVDGERLTLVVPDAAEPASEPGAILDSLAYASDRLRFGNRNDEVVTIVAPADEIDWGPPGLAIGPDTRVTADAAVEDDVNVWVHEYVHTRQYRDAEVVRGDAVADDAHWLIEGSADYYAALTSLERGLIDFQTFRSVLERGTESEYEDVVLTDRSTWEATDADYEKGTLVVGAIDRELRRASDGSATFQAVMQDWNDAETFTAEDLEASVAEHGDESVREFVETHTRTSATPSPWDREAHEAAFDTELARFDYRAVSEPTLSVRGPYREGALTEPLVVGETVATSIRATNVGDVAGSYRATLILGEDDRAVATGTLDPGESETVELSRRLNRTGTVRIVAGDVSRTVSVREPAAPAVSRMEVEPRSPVAGEDVRVTVTVTNTANRPADGNVTIRADGEAVGTEHVRLAPRENGTVAYTTSFEDAGEHELTAGELAVELSVEEAGVFQRLPPVALAALAVLAVFAVAGSAAILYRRER